MIGKFQKSGLDEGYVLNSWLKTRLKKNKNALIVTVGETGSGKTYSNLRIAESWYNDYFKEEYPTEYICFSIEQAIRLLSQRKLPKGTLLIIEEAGVIMNSLDFQQKLVKFFGFVLQSFRSKNIIIIFNLPNMGFLQKTARVLVHLTLIAVSIDEVEKKVKLKPLRTQVNPLTSKIYNKYLRARINHSMVPIKRLGYSMPSPKLIDVYEKLKDDFVNKTINKVMQVIEEQDEKEAEKTIEQWQQEILELHPRVGLKNMTTWASMLGISRVTLYQLKLDKIIIDLNASLIEKESKNSEREEKLIKTVAKRGKCKEYAMQEPPSFKSGNSEIKKLIQP